MLLLQDGHASSPECYLKGTSAMVILKRRTVVVPPRMSHESDGLVDPQKNSSPEHGLFNML